MPNVHIHVDGEFVENIQLERIQRSWGYCNKNASMKFVDIIAESLAVQRFCKYYCKYFSCSDVF